MKRKQRWSVFLLAGLLLTSSLSAALAQAPPLLLQDSIKIAEKSLDKVPFLDIKNYYIFSIQLTNSSKGNFWYYTLRAITPSEYNEIFVKIYMDGTTELSGGALSKMGY